MSKKSKFIDYECKYCGGKYHSMSTTDYCPYCGKPYAHTEFLQNMNRRKTKEEVDRQWKQTIYCIIGVVIVFIAIIVAGYFLISWAFF